jgi:putative hydrolase of the HAD superfamily
MPEPYTGCLFDLGDTLIHFAQVDVPRMFRAGARQAYRFLTDRGHDLPPFGRYHFFKMLHVRWSYLKSLLTGREFNSLDTLRRLNKKLGIQLSDEETVELAWQWYEPLSEASMTDPDAAGLLRGLHERGLKVGLVSNTFVPGEVLDRHLRQEGLLELLPVRIYSCDVKVRKPNPRIFRAALQRTGLEAGRTLFVGDQPWADIRGANQIGMTSVLKDPLGNFSNSRIVPKYRIRKLPELLKIVDAAANGSA